MPSKTMRKSFLACLAMLIFIVILVTLNAVLKPAVPFGIVDNAEAQTKQTS